MEFVVTDAREDMLAQILEIEQKSFSVPWTERMLRIQLEPGSYVFLAAVDGARVLGYVGLMYVLDEGYISNVAVHPDCRRQGVGSALLTALERRAREMALSFLTLEVRESNTGAAALYAGHGYRPVGRRKNYYDNPVEDAILMTKELN